eukprot:scaffold16015_cov527-Ochromonas_danica.AAC.1
MLRFGNHPRLCQSALCRSKLKKRVDEIKSTTKLPDAKANINTTLTSSFSPLFLMTLIASE